MGGSHFEYSTCLASRYHCHILDHPTLKVKRSDAVTSAGLVGCSTARRRVSLAPKNNKKIRYHDEMSLNYIF